MNEADLHFRKIALRKWKDELEEGFVVGQSSIRKISVMKFLPTTQGGRLGTCLPV